MIQKDTGFRIDPAKATATHKNVDKIVLLRLKSKTVQVSSSMKKMKITAKVLSIEN
jgi:hypothetical protein